MEGTPRLRSAYPATPSRSQRQHRSGGSNGLSRSGRMIRREVRDISELDKKPLPPPDEPYIPESLIEAPTQRLYAFTIWVALWSWKIYDFSNLQESEEQSLWLFMKWVAIDGLWLFGLPSLRIPWLEWSSATIVLLFCAHAVANALMMFRVSIPIGAGFALVGRSLWGAYELAVNEHRVNPRTIEFNESLILGRQIIHILPEGSAVLNAHGAAFCLDSSRPEAKLPITINSTNPILMEIQRVDLGTSANETLTISKSQIKRMHKEASRLTTYSDKPNEPKTLYYTVRKPGVYSLSKVIDESNLEVARKRRGQTVVVPCPKASLLQAKADRCKGELSSVELQVTGTPPLRAKYRRMVNHQVQESTFESIQPDDFSSPFGKTDTLVKISQKIEVDWVRPRQLTVPISESLGTTGRWVYSLSEVIDGLGNKVEYTDHDHEYSERHLSKAPHLHQSIAVHERPLISLRGCSGQNPLKVAKGRSTELPVEFGSSGREAMPDGTYYIDYVFTPVKDQKGTPGQSNRFTIKSGESNPTVAEAGMYTITGISTEFCPGEVLEPAACLIENPPEPQLKVTAEEIFDKCAGSSIGLRVDLDLIGTPPFDVQYQMTRKGERYHTSAIERIHGMRGQIELTPREAGEYTYDFVEVSDAVYKAQRISGQRLTQNVKPAASASISASHPKVACIDEAAQFDVSLHGEGPFTLDYELIHNGKREEFRMKNQTSPRVQIDTPTLHDGGEYILALKSITDGMGCSEFLQEQSRLYVRHQKPKVGFGQLEGKRAIDTLEDKNVELPLRLVGEGPWTIKYADPTGQEHTVQATQPNHRIRVDKAGTYQLLEVHDSVCPGIVDTPAQNFDINWITRPTVRISDLPERSGHTYSKSDICEGEDDSAEVLFTGTPPFQLSYTQHTKLDRGAIAPKKRSLRASLHSASLRMDTAQSGLYTYHLDSLEDSNYDHNAKHFSPLKITQRVNARPSASFLHPGKSYSYCTDEASGEEVIPIQLYGQPPFTLELEIRHHQLGRPELIRIPNIPSTEHEIRIPHSRLQLGRSSLSLRRVSDSNGCSRLLDSATSRVQISVHDAPTITPFDTKSEYCVGERINFALSGTAPFNIFYTFQNSERKAVAKGATFRRLAEKPGVLTITAIADAASNCEAKVNISRVIHGMPSVRVSHGREGYVDLHEGGETEILFEFAGTPPFEFVYTRSGNTERGGKKGAVLDMRQEVSEGEILRVKAGLEGTYEVVAIRDRYCAYAKPGVVVGWGEGRKRVAG
ncbi:hypothetical protein K470DRAFT_249053 [Piedraia hortae CBS 480.64]|uniref:Nucleoporin Pom152 n=1 Tax=Piedraia hortae CBS 480.64 TaxID=1314780 RepID=A0A6A7BX47_9PEZI|nr:hypothetical protein K470DRAFT_249053 [Piedraia hortae CBS 480.64]